MRARPGTDGRGNRRERKRPGRQRRTRALPARSKQAVRRNWRMPPGFIARRLHNSVGGQPRQHRLGHTQSVTTLASLRPRGHICLSWLRREKIVQPATRPRLGVRNALRALDECFQIAAAMDFSAEAPRANHKDPRGRRTGSPPCAASWDPRGVPIELTTRRAVSRW